MGKKALLITGVAAAAVVLGGATVAVAAGTQGSGPAVNLDRPFQVPDVEGPETETDDDSSGPAPSEAELDQAANAALGKVGQGTVKEVERENDGGAAYEVEIRLDNGSEVEVQVGA